MNKKAKRNFTVISLIVGFLIAVQYQTVQQPLNRDTRDVWEIQQELLAQLEKQSELLSQIQVHNETIDQYEYDIDSSNEKILLDTVASLKREAGLIQDVAPGITIELQPVIEKVIMGELPAKLTSDQLIRLTNQLYRYNAKYIVIEDQRLITTSVIRDINGRTTVNGTPLPPLPISIKVAASNWQEAQKLYNRMQGSDLVEAYFIDDIRISINEPMKELELPAFDETIRVKEMKPVYVDEGE